jgi:hypothetical protein
MIDLINQRINAACGNGKHDVHRELAELREAVLALPDADKPSLRDHFAMAALTGMWADPCGEGPVEKMARWAYRAADAMLAAREVAE